MSTTPYDAIVIGARCAGAPTGMLLARAGRRVLVVDRDTFPSDTISTHLIHPWGVAALRRWGLLERVIATGCPPIHTYAFDFGPVRLEGAPGHPDEPAGYAPRRTVLDVLLVEAARESGAEVREGFVVDELIVEDGRVAGIRGRDRNGAAREERARVVIGADGRNSPVARETGAAAYHTKPPIQCSWYSYWSGLPMDGHFVAVVRDGTGYAAWPTNDGLTLVVAGWPIEKLETVRADVEGHFARTIDEAPDFAARWRRAKREDRFYGTSVPNQFRKPFGPGWALVGDAGYNKDFITAQGISDAFRDAELCAGALADWFSGARGVDEAMGEYQARRDQQVLPHYEYTTELAKMTPPSPDMVQVLQATAGNAEAMDGFARVFAGTDSPPVFFSQENIGRIFAAAAAR